MNYDDSEALAEPVPLNALADEDDELDSTGVDFAAEPVDDDDLAELLE